MLTETTVVQVASYYLWTMDKWIVYYNYVHKTVIIICACTHAWHFNKLVAIKMSKYLQKSLWKISTIDECHLYTKEQANTSNICP